MDRQNTTPPSSRRYFDVRRPGRAPASATSRPVAVTPQAPAQAAQASVSGVGARPGLMDPHQKIQITPPTRAVPQAPSTQNIGWNPAPIATPASTPAPATPNHMPVFKSASTPSTSSPLGSATIAAAQSSQTYGGNSAGTAPVRPMSEDLIKEAAQEVGPAQDDIGAAVPPQQHASAWPVALLITIILLLLVATLDVLLDADILKLSIPHTDFL